MRLSNLPIQGAMAIASAVAKVPNCPSAYFPAVKKPDRRPPVDLASITLPRSPASLSSGDEVPHIFQPKEISTTTSARRLLQQNLPIEVSCSAAKSAINQVSRAELFTRVLASWPSAEQLSSRSK
jgi:hypothetical protein